MKAQRKTRAWVYLMRADRYYKIGSTSNVERRRIQLDERRNCVAWYGMNAAGHKAAVVDRRRERKREQRQPD